MPISFADEIRKFVQDYGITMSRLADASGISSGGLSLIVNGKNEAKIETIEKIRAGMRSIANPISEFGIWLSSAREKSGLSIPQLAEISNISAPAIYNIEGGKTQNPSSKTQKLISAAIEEYSNKNSKPEPAPPAEAIANNDEIGDLEEFDPYSVESYPDCPGVYIFYDISERPIYVGQSQNIKKRILDHEQKFWFKKPLVEEAAFVTIKNLSIRRKFEKVLIKFLRSNAVLNKGHVDREE